MEMFTHSSLTGPRFLFGLPLRVFSKRGLANILFFYFWLLFSFHLFCGNKAGLLYPFLVKFGIVPLWSSSCFLVNSFYFSFISPFFILAVII